MYEKQNFTDGSVLTAEQLNHMETGIAEAHDALPQKLTRPATAQVGDYLRIKAIGADGTMEVEAVPAPTGGATVPTKVSAFENDAGYTTETRVQELLAAFPTFEIEVVQELPAVGAEKTIYLVPFADDSGSYLEYLYVNGAWEVVGNGKDSGENPSDGEDGATFTPAVSEDGTLSWMNDKGLENPTPVNIKGPKGDTGEQGIQGEIGPAGADGAKGDKGDTGESGKDGTSVTHSWNGTTLTVTSASGTSSANLKGDKGDKGDQGEKGDTGAKGDKGDTGAAGADGKDGLDATPVTPLFANSIEECTDTDKFYVLPDGFIYAYMPSAGPSYTNLAGTITYDKRLSSSGKASSSAMAGAAYTDFIPVKKGQIVCIKNFDIYSDFSSSAFPYVCFYTGASEDNVVSSTPYVKPSVLTTEFSGCADSVNGDVVTWTAFVITGSEQHSLADSITHIRISGKYFTDQEIIVTVGEEITEGGSGGYAWQNTGHAFIPADYEDRILALEDHADAIPESRIEAIEDKLDTAAPADYSGNILYGKKWAACGDSFTANGYNASDGFDESVYIYQDGRFIGMNIVYPYIIGLRNNMDIVNLASGGQTMAASDNSFMSVYRSIPSDADYITIMLGINDKVQGLSVGTLEDSMDSTFCGAFNIAMEHILENHPFAHIGIMVSHGTNADIMEATRGIAERWGVPYLDYGSSQVPLMNRYTGRNVCAKAQEIREKNFCVLSDGTTATNGHPNTAAHEYESTFIEAWLRTL